jgi:hypothetical protein
VPRSCFLMWIELAKPIYQSIAQKRAVSLLNTTIRFVHQDTESVLAYSRNKEGSYAFVLYFRIARTKEGDKALQRVHNELAEITLKVGGSFYLPYRHHYTQEQLERAYGRETLSKLLAAKEKYDPNCLFSSIWFQKYLLHYASEQYQALMLQPVREPRKDIETKPTEEFIIPIVSEQRPDSYRKLFRNALQRRRFVEQFLTRVFHVEDPSRLYQFISRAVWDPKNKKEDIYVYIQNEISKFSFNSKISDNLIEKIQLQS